MRDAEMQIECAIHSGGVSRGAASVEEVLGGGHEFMHEHEHEHEKYACHLGLCHNGAVYC